MSVEDFSRVLELDPAKDGTWSQDESSKLIGGTTRRGRENALQPMAPGVMALTVQNSDGRFSPDKGVITDLDSFVPIRLYSTWTEPAHTNLVDNPSVENDLTGWAALAGTAITRSALESKYGAFAVRQSNSAVNPQVTEVLLRSGSRFAVTAGLDYVWKAEVRVVAGVVTTAWFARIFWFNSGGGLISTSDGAEVDTAADSDWTLLTVTAAAPTGAVTAALRIQESVVKPASVGGVFFDGADFYQSSDTTLPYIDGDQPAATWDGTAHESTSSRGANPSFLLFQGFIFDIELQEDHLDRTATLICMDRLALLSAFKISMGNLLSEKTGLILHRLFDRVEGELITNWGVEWTELSGNLTVGYSPVGGGGVLLAVNRIPNSGSEGDFFEGDWVLEVRPDGAVNDGVRYDATTDIAATGDYQIVWYARAKTSDVSVKFRFLRDAVIEKTLTFLLTSTWQRFVIDVSFSTLGTNRYIEMVNASALSLDFLVDDLHAIKKMNQINRDFDIGQAALDVVNAYEEPAGPVIADVLESEPGILFVKAGTLAVGDEIAFRDEASRDSVVPRIVFGDGDGLLPFAEGLSLTHRAADRIGRVVVTSRGKLVLGAASTTGWGLSPKRTTATGEEFQARFEQTLRGVIAVEKGGVAVEDSNVNFGAGADVEITTGAAGSMVGYEGRPYDRTTEESIVIKTADLGLPLTSELPVRMPLQGNATTAMTNEAQRLIDKYKNRVIRCSLPLQQVDDVLHSWLLDIELDDQIIVRADNQAHSPGFDKKFFVEGIEHTIDASINTILLLEEA